MSEKTSQDNSKICGICEINISKYCCPRCNVFYCCLGCYKSENHSECSEGFYRDCVNEDLASNNFDEESKRKMLFILKEMHEQSTEDDVPDIQLLDSDDDDGVDLHERMKDLDLDDADSVWNALTADEKNDFQALVDQAEIESFVPQWEPWWMYRKQDKLIEEVDGPDEEGEALKKCPDIRSAPKFDTLAKIQPSSIIKYNISNALAAYVFIMRYFNGDVEPMEAVMYLFDICTNLGSNVNFKNPTSAIESVAQKCFQSDEIETDEASLDVMKYDLYLLLNGPSEENKLYYCNAALSQLIDILVAAKNCSKINNENNKLASAGVFAKKFPDRKPNWIKLDGKKIKKVIRKVEYYLSYIQSCKMYFDL